MTSPADPLPASRTLPASRSLRAIRRRILAWYDADHRDFPWRRTTEPWAVLVSEVMLQQTQASRVVERFPPFLARFPTPATMAAATDAEVLAAWSGLGYNRRAIALRRVATAVERDGWPDDVAGLEQLPGIGAYTARAVAALAFGMPVGAVDTNVRRWLIRRLGLPADASPTVLQHLADGLAVAATNGDEAMRWMHASMEFGGRICSARSPACGSCPVARGCPSRGRAGIVPVPRQPAFAGSSRERRGRLLRLLTRAEGHHLSLRAVRQAMPDADLEPLLEDLERDGLLHRRGASLHLGSRDGRTAVATIDS